MKTRVIIAAFILMATVSFAQNQKINEIEVTAPKFQSEFYQSVNDFLSMHVQYPTETKNAGLQGTEVVQFVITPNGEVKDFKIINSVSPDVDKEVIRILEATNKKWEPGTVDGNPVNMKTEVSVSFFLHSAEDMVKTAKDYQQKGNNWMFEKNNPKKALKYYNRAIVMLPGEEGLLAMRGLCNYRLGNQQAAFTDWNRINTFAENKNTNKEFDSIALNVEEAEIIAERILNLHK